MTVDHSWATWMTELGVQDRRIACSVFRRQGLIWSGLVWSGVPGTDLYLRSRLLTRMYVCMECGKRSRAAPPQDEKGYEGVWVERAEARVRYV